jgi:osmotically-inducible protein OsmY
MRLSSIALAVVLLVSGCKARDGDLLAQVCRKTGQKLGALTGDAPEQLGRTFRGSAGDASLAARVSNRIRWDRYLAKVSIEVETTAAGTVALTGQVSDLSLKQRIIDLAKSTSGVQHVEDRMTLPAEK